LSFGSAVSFGYRKKKSKSNQARKKLRQIKRIIIHCSASAFGHAEWIRGFHKNQFGFPDIGYHKVILNGFRHSFSDYDPKEDGLIETGLDIDKIGYHCKGHNEDSLGICLIGNKAFSQAQIIALKVQIYDYFKLFGRLEIQGHYELDNNKTCPNIPMDVFRKEFERFYAGLTNDVIMQPRKI
jgi:N-acetylmuramoyl-L-alanine amidase